MVRIFFIIAILAISSVRVWGQDFVRVAWNEPAFAQTLPVITEEVPLDDDFRSYNYRVEIEFPEFEPVSPNHARQLAELPQSLPARPQIEQQIAVSARRGYLTMRFVPIVFRDGQFQKILSYKLSIIAEPLSTRAASAAVTRSSAWAENSVLATGRFVRITITQDGVYAITHAELRQMGFANPAKVRLLGYGGHLLSQRFNEHPADDLPEIPVHRTADALLFFGRGVLSWQQNTATNSFARQQNFYANEASYFLTDALEGEPKDFPVEASLPASEHTLTTFNDYALHERDAWSWSKTGRELYEDYDYAGQNSRRYSFKLPGITDDHAVVSAEFAARSLNQSTSFAIHTADKELGRTTISQVPSLNSYYTKAMSATLHANWNGAKTEDTQITITHNRPSGVSGRLNYLSVSYTRSLSLTGSHLAFRSLASVGKATTFVLSGANANTLVWDVTSPTHYRRMEGTLQGSTFSFTIPAGQLRQFVAVNTAAGFAKVTSAGQVPNQNLHALPQTDMVIITPPKSTFIAQAERLAEAHRQKDNLTVEVVTATQVYNEFSSGTPDATAYRRLMKMLYDRSTSETDRPKYLLLFGDCAYDNRMVSAAWQKHKPEDYLLCYQSENSLNEISSYITDDYFGFLDDNEGADLSADKLDIGVGRFPVRTTEEAKAAVDKTIAYMENKHAGPWKHTVCYAADDGDNNLHISQAELLATETERDHPLFMVKRVYEDAFKRQTTATGSSYPDANRRLLQLFDQGMLVVNYTGHGSTSAWAAENLLTLEQINQMTSPRLPLWVTATCDFTRFDDTDTSAGEAAFLNPKGGAIALFTTTRVVYASQNSTINQAFLKHIFSRPDGRRLRLGDIMRLSKCDITLNGDRNKLNFSLIGDPALTLAYPDYGLQIDEFNTAAPTQTTTISAGARITVKGHVLTPEGTPATDFDGTLHPTVLDSRETIKTLNNLDEGAYTYSEQSKTLFTGTYAVEQGGFEFTFPVPMDINYSDLPGMLNLYALGTDRREAGGYFDNFRVGGTATDAPNDGEGPKMMLYLNTPDFAWGAQTNETPWFVAELEDPDGINTVGNGIGHDLTLVIDGDATRTYSLNDRFTPVAGDFTRGTVRFSIPTLPDGKHSLQLRAWDLMNNSSVATLDFEVVQGLRLSLFDAETTQNPARESTTFVLSHNRPGSALNITLTVYDTTGRPRWTQTLRDTTADTYYYIDWDLRDTNGARLPAGIYLYSATMATDGSRQSTQSRKIVVLAQ